MAEATGDDVFDVGGDEEHSHPSSDRPDAVGSLPNLENIQKILHLVEPGEPGDVGVESSEDVRDDDAEVLSDGPDAHLDPSEDVTYSQRLRRIPAPSQKAILNKKWSDTKA